MASKFTCCHGKTISPGKSWVDKDGFQHPPNWQIWSAEDKEAHGITEVILENPPDSRLYKWSQNDDGTINKTAKDLDDSGSGDSLRLGVKSSLKQTINTQQGSLLNQTDWYIIRKADKGTPIPSDMQQWRDAIRVRGDEMKAAIDEAVDTDAVAALFISYDENYEKLGILYDWPEME